MLTSMADMFIELILLSGRMIIQENVLYFPATA